MQIPSTKGALKRAHKEAEQLLHHAEKVDRYRRDVMSEAQLQSLRAAAQNLRDAMLAPEASADSVHAAMKALDPILRKVGGKLYPLSFWAENVEVFLVAAILAIGVRAFFLQPFKIPTNSMFPTYAGMVTEVFATPEEVPSAAEQVVNKFLTFASYYQVIAPADGELTIPFTRKVNARGEARWAVASEPVRKWGIFSQQRYTLLVGGQPVHLDMPAQFPFDQFILDTFPPQSRPDFSSRILERHNVRTGKLFKKGEAVLNFALETGDMLFVDRMSYHFKAPEVGDPFVFRTEQVPGLRHEEVYYIKRIVGQGGDTLEVRDYGLIRNGEPITGAPAFARNAARDGKYTGYIALSEGGGYEPNGKVLPDARIPQGNFFAMGDNSFNSFDGRNWGYVPEQAIAGKAFFIFYPFTHRWGLAE